MTYKSFNADVHEKVIHTCANQQPEVAGLYKYVWPFSGVPGIKGLKMYVVQISTLFGIQSNRPFPFFCTLKDVSSFLPGLPVSLNFFLKISKSILSFI